MVPVFLAREQNPLWLCPVFRQTPPATREDSIGMTADGPKTAQAFRKPVLPAASPLPDDLPAALRRAADLTQLSEPRLLRALAWWQALRDDPAGIPDRSRLDPTAIPELLPWAILWDVLPAGSAEPRLPAGDGLRYRCRLAGTMLNDVYGREARGQWLHEQFGEESEAMQLEYDAVVQLRRPLWSTHRMSWANKPYYRYLRLMLPFTHRATAEHSETPALRDEPARVALIFSVISFIGE